MVSSSSASLRPLIAAGAGQSLSRPVGRHRPGVPASRDRPSRSFHSDGSDAPASHEEPAIDDHVTDGYERCEELARVGARAAGARSGDVDDIVQDCLILTAEDPRLLDPEQCNDSYLITMFRREANSYLKADRLRREAEAANPLRPAPEVPGYQPGLNPETYVMRAWTVGFCRWLAGTGPLPDWGISAQAREALETLPVPDAGTREALRRWMDGESQERIGRDLGISQQAVSKKIAKRVEQIRDLTDSLPDLLDELYALAA